jgi:hypothetical protein
MSADNRLHNSHPAVTPAETPTETHQPHQKPHQNKISTPNTPPFETSRHDKKNFKRQQHLFPCDYAYE